MRCFGGNKTLFSICLVGLILSSLLSERLARDFLPSWWRVGSPQSRHIIVPPANGGFSNRLPIAKSKPYSLKTFYVTAYTLRPEETDSSPTISASGADISKVKYSVACPRRYKFGTIFYIQGCAYICLDRLSTRFDERLDINFHYDYKGAISFGIKKLEVRVYETR